MATCYKCHKALPTDHTVVLVIEGYSDDAYTYVDQLYDALDSKQGEVRVYHNKCYYKIRR